MASGPGSKKLRKERASRESMTVEMIVRDGNDCSEEMAVIESRAKRKMSLELFEAGKRQAAEASGKP